MGKCPGRTVNSIACKRQHVNDAKEEEWCWDIKEGGEDADGQSEERAHRTQEVDTLDWKESAERRQAAGKNKEEIVDNSTLTGVKSDEGGKPQSWLPAMSQEGRG
ncbi:hypothetical protein NDU88_002278 [Pleurodeles waltl]|uniref:Uncharacterized protein n=1 Tax=Pleurodeles waltl TaxID=8319 RepID=A0AAV7VE47_PLEWA|nr:hypothetical protein NDU88_002278 [Pleurodeles waltl]